MQLLQSLKYWRGYPPDMRALLKCMRLLWISLSSSREARQRESASVMLAPEPMFQTSVSSARMRIEEALRAQLLSDCLSTGSPCRAGSCTASKTPVGSLLDESGQFCTAITETHLVWKGVALPAPTSCFKSLDCLAIMDIMSGLSCRPEVWCLTL